MSVNIAAQPVSAAIPPVTEYQPRTNQRVRPVESTASASNDREHLADNKKAQTANAALYSEAKAAPSDRPPGKDRSIPPQALFDASLISSEFKADLKLGTQPKTETESTAPSIEPQSSTHEATESVAKSDSSAGAAIAEQVTEKSPQPLAPQVAAANSATQIQDPTNRSSGAPEPAQPPIGRN